MICQRDYSGGVGYNADAAYGYDVEYEFSLTYASDRAYNFDIEYECDPTYSSDCTYYGDCCSKPEPKIGFCRIFKNPKSNIPRYSNDYIPPKNRKKLISQEDEFLAVFM